MLNSALTRVREAVRKSLEVACEDDVEKLQGFSIEKDGDMLLVDQLGFTSMQIAVVLSQLEWELGFNPFDRADVNFTDVRTVNDLCRAFMTKEGPVGVA